MKPIYFIVISIALFFYSCEKMVAIDSPKYQLSDKEVFKSKNTADAAIQNMYLRFNSSYNYETCKEIMGAGMCADELVNAGPASPDWDQLAENRILPDNGWISSIWPFYYGEIYKCNAALNALQEATYKEKDLFRGEALFIRAYWYLNLINLWGDVPYLTTTDVTYTATAPRTKIEIIYDSITADLEEAYSLLPVGYEHAANKKVRANKWAAAALLARVYLYRGNWQKAEQYATGVISSGAYHLVNLSQVFSPNNSEAIFQALPYGGAASVNYIGLYLSSQLNFYHIAITNSLANAFEPNDKRKTTWLYTQDISGTTWYFPYKYTKYSSAPEYVTFLRLAEVFLIRAEARAEQDDDLSEAIADLDTIRGRAGLPLIADANPSIGKEDLLTAILQERRVELFAEWLHRWIDLKRTGRASAVLGPVKPDWQPTDELWPIPQLEIKNNPNLAPNNPGYGN